MSYLYFIRSENTDKVKIGFSKDPNNRVEQLQIGNINKLILEYSYKVNDARYAEKIVHTDLKRFRIRGEWFKISSDDLKEYLIAFEEVRLNSI